MKTIKYIIRIFFTVLIGVYLLMLVIINFGPTQQWLTHVVEESLEDKLVTEIEIGKVEVGLFNRLTLRDVVVYDQSEREMLKAGLLSAKIELLPLLQGEVSLRTVSALDAKVELYKPGKTDPSNFQFLIDAFAAKEKKEKKVLNLCVNSIILRRCHVGYDEFYKQETPGLLNPSHLEVSGLDANISLKRLTNDSLNLRVRSLKFKEKSGLDIRSLSLRMAANRRHCDIYHFAMELPNSRLSQDKLQADYRLDGAHDFMSTLKVNGSLREARMATDDIAFLVPKLNELDQIIEISTDFNVSPKRVALENLSAREKNNNLSLRADLCMQRDSGKIKSVVAAVNHLSLTQHTVSSVFHLFSGQKMPQMLENIGDFSFKGNLDYDREEWSSVKGCLLSSLGNLQADLQWQQRVVAGKVNVALDNINTILGNSHLPERLVFELQGKGDFSTAKPSLQGDMNLSDLVYRGYAYHDIKVHGNLSNSCLTAQLLSTNKNADLTLDFNADLNGNRLSNLGLSADVRDFNPTLLNLTDYFDRHSLSSRMNVGLENLNFAKPVGYLKIRDFRLTGDQPYHLSALDLSSATSERGTLLKMQSDFGSARLDGPLSLPKFKTMLNNLIGYKFPGLAQIDTRADKYKWLFNVRFSKSDFFQEVLHLPIRFDHGLEAEGFLSSGDDRVFLSAVAEHLSINKTQLRDLRILLRNYDENLLSRIQVDKMIGKENLHFELENATRNGNLLTDFVWSDLAEGSYSGTFKTETSFSDNKLVSTQILPTHMTINDTVWHILPGEITLLGDSVDIRNFEIQHADQGLKLQGKLSKNPHDSLMLSLKKIDVEYILGMVNLGSFSFGGLASGRIAMKNTFDSLQVSARLDIPDFHFNGGFMGHADIQGSWNIDDQRLNLLGDIQEEGWGFTKVTGYVGLAEKALDLHIESKNSNIYCLNRYIGDIFYGLNGRTTGDCRVYGPFKGIDFEGTENAVLQAEIAATGADYEVSGGRVVMSSGKFSFENLDIVDEFGGRGKLNGNLLHHHLKNIRYNMNISADHMLVYDKPQSVDLPFYATAFGTGSVKLSGRPGLMEADINMRPEKKTVFVYTVDTPEGFGDVQLLRFSDVSDTVSVKQQNADDEMAETTNTSSTDILLNFMIDMNPEATLKVIMDRRTGDHLLVHGYGPLRATFYNKGDFQMFGKLNVDRGVYKMSIQDVIRKDFEFTKGSFINFSGDPFFGDLGLRAIYTVNSASLSDLNIGNNLSDNSVRVNCVLNFSGKVKSPQVSFDLELPTVSEDVQQMVRNLISSEEDMNMQILYLLGVGRFYTYNYSSIESATNQSQSAVAMKSFLSNTLSSQLNNIISNAVGSSNWSFGANLSTGQVGWSDMEVEGILSGRLLNNRLLINGNFGYRDRPTYSSTANFIGDFDVRYLLTPGGGISLKAYSETNDRYFSKSSLSTQGIGLLLKRDFSNLKDLFTPRKRRGINDQVKFK